MANPLLNTPIRLLIQHGTIQRIEKPVPPSRRQRFEGISAPLYQEPNRLDPADYFYFEASKNTDVSSWPDGSVDCMLRHQTKDPSSPLVCVPIEPVSTST